jgi:putative phosphoribosyl transferase
MPERSAGPPRAVTIPVAGGRLWADVRGPGRPRGLAVFAHGSGSGRKSPRNVLVASALEQAGVGSLLLDLLTETEAEEDAESERYRFDIPMLADRLLAAVEWVRSDASGLGRPSLGLYGASTGGAAAMIVAARRPALVQGLVLRGARSDLADEFARGIEAPTLFIVGDNDPAILEVNRVTAARMHALVRIEIVPGATHLFEEPGALEAVAEHTVGWFREKLGLRAALAPGGPGAGPS